MHLPLALHDLHTVMVHYGTGRLSRHFLYPPFSKLASAAVTVGREAEEARPSPWIILYIKIEKIKKSNCVGSYGWSERATERRSDGAMEQRSDIWTERRSDEATERRSDKATKRQSDRETEGQRDRSMERQNYRMTKRRSDKTKILR